MTQVKNQIYQSIKTTGIFVEPEDSGASSQRSACKVYLDPEKGIVVVGSPQVTSSITTLRTMED